ncbi:MAG: DUF2203 family protein [Calditrichae bacterium]|nr:DUF2203 family protein [Calditrichia bacterium]NIW78182.1 DUF2203 family protein [Calditrichia bacterium]
MELNAKKYFTPAEANRTLPLVKRIVADILNLSHELRSLSVVLGAEAEGHPQLENIATQIRNHFAELEELGCYYKDWNFSIGLVDFPAVIDGKEVFLCWRSDEDSVEYYHEIETGYAGRKRIPEQHLSD